MNQSPVIQALETYTGRLQKLALASFALGVALLVDGEAMFLFLNEQFNSRGPSVSTLKWLPILPIVAAVALILYGLQNALPTRLKLFEKRLEVSKLIYTKHIAYSDISSLEPRGNDLYLVCDDSNKRLVIDFKAANAQQVQQLYLALKDRIEA